MQGWRNTMEDSHIANVELDNNVSVFGVFDGHGGMLELINEYPCRLGSCIICERKLY